MSERKNCLSVDAKMDSHVVGSSFGTTARTKRKFIPASTLSGLAIILIIMVSASPAFGQNAAEAAIKDREFSDLAKNPPNVTVAPSAVNAVRKMLWAKYVEMVKSDPVRQKEMADNRLNFNGKTMRYKTVKVYGDKSVDKKKRPLYIAMHGGGGGSARMNDGQWEHMKRYYLPNVKHGIYVAPRGVTNTWNLHFVHESYVCYDRMIENMIAFENVDPNKVYVLGFSAGGDGAYQIPARMPDRWAAANMSAGHHNGVSPKNVFNVAFLIQVGEKDARYKRNKEAAKYFMKLEKLATDRDGWYEHDAFIHVNRPHNFLDNHPQEKKQAVMKSPGQWLKTGDRTHVMKNTSAIRWLSKHTRNPYPTTVFWDLKTGTNRSGIAKDGTKLWTSANKGRQCYWLDLADVSPKDAGCDEIIASYERKTNTIMLKGKPSKVRILLHESMVDFSKEITIDVNGNTFDVTVKPSLKTMIRTLMERGDPNYCFAADIEVAN